MRKHNSRDVREHRSKSWNGNLELQNQHRDCTDHRSPNARPEQSERHEIRDRT